jgi:hypothetical protein
VSPANPLSEVEQRAAIWFVLFHAEAALTHGQLLRRLRSPDELPAGLHEAGRRVDLAFIADALARLVVAGWIERLPGPSYRSRVRAISGAA